MANEAKEGASLEGTSLQGRGGGGGKGSQLIAMWALVSFFGEEVELGCCCFAAELSTCKKPAREAHPQC